MSMQIESANPVVKAVIEGAAPRPAMLAAARGVLPLPQNDLLEVLVNFAASADKELAEHARHTLAAQDASFLESAVRSPDVAATVLNYFAERQNVPKAVHESIITNAKTPAATLVNFARTTTSGELLDLISLNQQLLIQTPAIIDAIIGNKHSSSEAGRKAAETKREFFEKERGAQQIANELRAQGKEAAAEFIEQADIAGDPDFNIEDALFLAQYIEVPDSETDDSWLGLEYIEEIYAETVEQREALAKKIIGEFQMDESGITFERVSVINRIMKMGMKDRCRLAAKGDREARNILIRDPNRLVSTAVVMNPRISRHEIEHIASMRTVTGVILRQIAINRKWTKNYSIIHNLAKNPRTPIANVLTILSRLQLRDLKALSKNRNVSDAVRQQALRLSNSRSGI